MALAGPSSAQPKEGPDISLAAFMISSRIPDFWTESPRLWFMQFETIIANLNLSDEVKYNLLMAKLSKDITTQASDILLAPPHTKRFETLKNRLLQCYEKSESRQLKNLLSEMELGDQKPSQLLIKMKDLARNKLPDETLKIMWTGHLPQAVRAELAVSDVMDLDNLGATADKIIETPRPIGISELTSMRSTASRDKDLAEEIAKLSLEEVQLRSRPAWRSSRRGRRRSHAAFYHRQQETPSSRSSQAPKNSNWLCFYHFRLKHRALKCVQPCAWKDEEETGN